MKMAVAGVFMAAMLAQGELLRVEQGFGGMECASCERSIVAGVKRLRGVDSAEVDGKNSRVRIVLRQGNRVKLRDIRDAVKATGFTPGDAAITVRGKAEKGRLVVGEETFELVDAPELPPGEVEVQGTVPASGPGAPLRLNYRARTEAETP